MNNKPDDIRDLRWATLLHHVQDPLFVMNQRRQIIFSNAAWQSLTNLSSTDAKSLTCTTRDTGQTYADLASVLSPSEEAMNGTAITVRRPCPGRQTGPPWWDVDFMPFMNDGKHQAILGRIRVVDSTRDVKSSPITDSAANLRLQTQQRYSLALWESAVPAVRRMATQARLVATAVCPAALVGETGTGKRTLARAIHVLSARRELPFVGLACDRLPADAIRAAIEPKPENIGMVYLQAPASLPRDLQAELAKRLSDRTHVLLGCPTEPASDLRDGRLTEELWAAASTVVISVLPLRLRLPDLPRLVDKLLSLACANRTVHLTAAAMENLRSHSWPGNLNELDDVLRLALARTDQSVIDVGDLPLALRESVDVPPPRESFPPLDKLLEQVEARMIRLALDRAGGNKTKAAELLGIWRPRLLRRMEALGIADSEETT